VKLIQPRYKLQKMLAVGASCANEYAKEEKEKEKNTTFYTKCHKALLKYKKDYLLNNMLV